MINIDGLEKYEVLLALWKSSKILGVSFLGMYNPDMNVDDAIKEVEHRGSGELYFDYVNGRVIKCDLTGREFNPFCYDKDNGEGKAQEVINKLRKELGYELD